MESTALRTTALVALVFCGLLAGTTVAGADQSSAGVETGGTKTIQSDATALSDEPTIVATTEYRLTPTEPGRVDVHWQFDVPENVGSITTAPVATAESLRVSGFERNVDGTYTWDADEQPSRTPSMTFTVPVNRTLEVAGPVDAGGKYSFVDAGDWALFKRQMPRDIGYTYRSTSPEPTIDRRSATAGPGVVGSGMVYLGPYESAERAASGQTFRLVVPEAATLTEEQSTIFASVTAASDRLRVGDRDERVLMIAAPREVPWAIRGLQVGDGDFYVVANETVDAADNVWLHEYLHTRQTFETTDRSAWLVEASAEYYAGLLTLEQERIGFEEFRRYLDRGTNRRWSDVRLVERTTWGSNGGNYVKGALVTGALDHQLREATGSSASFQRVFEQLNRRETVTHAEFVGVVERTSDASVRDFARQYTETTATPSSWSRPTHQRVFGRLPAAFSYTFHDAADSWRMTGPYGNRTYTTDGLVSGESLTTPITVTNVGGEDGTYELSVTRDGEQIATRSDTLRAGARTNESVTQTFADAGQYRLSTGDDTVTVRVRRPAPLVVTNMTATRVSSDSKTVRVTATVANQFARPGEGTVTLRRGPEELAREQFSLRGGETAPLTATTELEGPGAYEFAAGNASLTLTVAESDSDETSASGSDTPGTNGPGFGPLAVLLAIAVCLLLAHRTE